jgi:hypothetical protein
MSIELRVGQMENIMRPNRFRQDLGKSNTDSVVTVLGIAVFGGIAATLPMNPFIELVRFRILRRGAGFPQCHIILNVFDPMPAVCDLHCFDK